MKGDFTRSTWNPEKHYSGVRMQQGRVQLDADWNEQLDIQAHRDRTTARDVIGSCGGPREDAGFALRVDDTTGALLVGAGRYYVDGILCENDEEVAVTAQPDLPGEELPGDAGLYLAYLDVWERHLTVLDDPDIREVALGGPDTATRTKTVWQVKLLPAGAIGDEVTCSTELDAWTGVVTAPSGRLAARAEPATGSDDPCLVPPSAGYRGLENQLYRVEIHDGGSLGAATFVWSRDNGSVASAWTAKDGDDLTIAATGRDAVLGFAAGDWVELTDDTRELSGEPGTLVQLQKVSDRTLTIDAATATGPVELGDFPVNPRVRRWNVTGDTGAVTVEVPADNEGWIELEDGVQVKFEAGDFRSGDYWLIPARTATGDIEWPVDDTGEPAARAPDGIERHYCRLALLRLDSDGWHAEEDCRSLFSPLTEAAEDEPEPAVHVTRVALATGSLENDARVPTGTLAQGIRIVCDAAIEPAPASRATCFVTIELPFPLNAADQTLWGDSIVGFQPIVLDAEVAATTDTIRWTPTKTAGRWLEGRLLRVLAERKLSDPLLARLTLKGNFIWAAADPESYLDGEAFGARTPNATSTAVRLPSGDGVGGGDFTLWFWLVAGKSTKDSPIDVNTAGEAELTAIPGIDPALARGIIEKRPYTTVDDLLRVKGIGPKTLDKLRGQVTV